MSYNQRMTVQFKGTAQILMEDGGLVNIVRVNVPGTKDAFSVTTSTGIVFVVNDGGANGAKMSLGNGLNPADVFVERINRSSGAYLNIRPELAINSAPIPSPFLLMGA